MAALLLLLLPAPSSAAPAALRLREVAGPWGLAFRHHHGGSGERYMVETMVGGVVLFDYDGDGDEDAFFVDGGRLPGYEGEEPRSRLYRNEGGGRFTDVTEGSGIRVAAYGCGATAADYDSDGDLDLYVTAFGPNQLFENRGDGTFTDVTAAAGVGDPRWSMSAGFSDPDSDGDLDLYVTNYVDFGIDNHKFCGNAERGLRAYCNPASYNGQGDRYYRNRGDGTFEDATAAAGFGRNQGPGLGLAWGDLDGDGRVDVYVANDSAANNLFKNRGDGTFEDQSLLSGTSYSDRGRPEAGMGVDLGDTDGDGLLDIVVTNFELETNALYRNTGDGLFLDARYAAGVAESSLSQLAFGVVLADLDADGDLDLVVANGHILDNARELNPASRYAQPNQVLVNDGSGRFTEAPGTGVGEVVRVSRGLAAGDLDGDLDQDLVFVNSNDVAEVYENLTDGGRSLLVDLRSPGGNRFAVDARAEVRRGERVQIREVRTASSYLSQGPLSLHFGLGEAQEVESLEVRWPGGGRTRVRGIPAGRRVTLYGPPS